MDETPNLPWWRHDRPWGFRLSAFDGIVLAMGIVFAIVSAFFSVDLSLATGLVLGHFLLFCNFFRLGAERSLIWIGVLLVNVFAWSACGYFSWPGIIAVQVACTFALIVSCVMSVGYHGIACERINPEHYRDGARGEGQFTRRLLAAAGVPAKTIDLLTSKQDVIEGIDPTDETR